MHSLETEFRELQHAGELDDAAARAIAIESRTQFSVAPELRIASYGAVTAIVAGLGLFLKKNLDGIGPLAITMGLAGAAAGCYAVAMRMRRRGARTPSISTEYVLLLGALILSADVGWAESQFHWLGTRWGWELAMLAVLHAATAYLFDSVVLLTLSLTSLAAWFGVGLQVNPLFRFPTVSGWSVLECAAVIVTWREIHRRAGGARRFLEVFDTCAANLALWSTILLSSADRSRLVGAALAVVLGVLSILYGLKTLRETYVIYGVVYPAIVFCIVVGRALNRSSEVSMLAVMLLAVVTAAALLMVLHGLVKGRR